MTHVSVIIVSVNGKAKRRWLGTSPCDNKRTIALRTNALRAYEGKSSELIPPGPQSQGGTVASHRVMPWAATWTVTWVATWGAMGCHVAGHVLRRMPRTATWHPTWHPTWQSMWQSTWRPRGIPHGFNGLPRGSHVGVAAARPTEARGITNGTSHGGSCHGIPRSSVGSRGRPWAPMAVAMGSNGRQWVPVESHVGYRGIPWWLPWQPAAYHGSCHGR